MFDLVIKGATVYDGSGKPGATADVAVRDGRIAEVGRISAAARQSVDATGLALMPGIIDLHTHYDAQVTWDPTLSPSPSLGVTTAVMGNCGFGIAPCPAPQRQTVLRNLSVVEGMDLPALEAGVRWEAETFGDYLGQLRRIGPYANVAVLAQHSTIRSAVMGEEASTRAVPSIASPASGGLSTGSSRHWLPQTADMSTWWSTARRTPLKGPRQARDSKAGGSICP